ncbi:uncharacterized protein LOC108851026 [Raphanus sativus]|uniref:Uncharacterized protein LOC108851026 n=1 Tax=Raphanus sativus TaxID=3726 RepID=A0A9W3DJK6_RAPSA|nr:uncharacterized protein LOC108851026 [Raphanus sativus]
MLCLTRIAKDDSRETRGGERVHVDAVVSNINNNSVLKPPTESLVVSPRDASVPHPLLFGMSSALERAESMRQWKEMKQNGFLSGALGGPVASRPRKSRRRRRGDSSKKGNQVPDTKDQHVTAPPPSGLLTGMKPGIIRHVRSKEQVYSVLESLIRNADSNARDSTRQDKLSDHDIPFTDPEQAKSLAVEAATVASQWLDFLHQDLSERLSAAQDSRNRVDDTLKAELPLLVSSANQESSTSGGDVSLDETVTEAHQMKWSAKFDEFKKQLQDQEKDLETALNQVKDMQSQCNEGLRQMKEASFLALLQYMCSLGKDSTNQETNLAVQAAAASIFSTCRYLLSKMKPPPNSS